MHDLSITLLCRVQQLVKSKQQSTNTRQSMYAQFILSAHQVKMFGRSVLLKRKKRKKGKKTDKTHPQNRGFKVHPSNAKQTNFSLHIN